MNEQILDLIEQGEFIKAKNLLVNQPEADIADFFENLDERSRIILFRLLPKDLASEVFSHLNTETQEYLISILNDDEIVEIIEDLFLDDAVDLLEEMPANVVKRILRNTNPLKRARINHFLNYREDTAGSLMTIEYVDLKKEMTVKQATEYIRRVGVDKETINTCYVIDPKRILEGVVSLRTLILADEDKIVGDLMQKDVVYLETEEDQEDVAMKFRKYDYYVMPVVDKEKRLVGIITVDDILDVVDREATEDMHRMAAMTPSETPYLQTTTFQLAKSRLPWLLILMVSATFTGRIVAHYESLLQSTVILAAFIPMLMDAGGNAGSQTSTLIVRGLALDEVKPGDFLRILGKEISVSFFVGLVMGMVNFIRLVFLDQIGVMVSLTVSLTLFFTIVLSKVAGGLLPLFAKKINLDPALMVGPLITTIVDAVALTVYLTTATLLLGIG